MFLQASQQKKLKDEDSNSTCVSRAVKKIVESIAHKKGHYGGIFGESYGITGFEGISL